MTDFVRSHERIEADGYYKIRFTNPPYNNVTFSFDKVELVEHGDGVKLKYTYYIHEGIITDKQGFDEYLGDFLVELIDQGLLNNDLIYTGGVDDE